MKELKITIEGKEYAIRPLTIGQLEDLHVGVMTVSDAKDPKQLGKEFWEQQVGILATALRVDHPEMTEEMLRKLRWGSIKEVKKQVAAVLEYAGFEPVPEPKPGDKPGEAQAGATA